MKKLFYSFLSFLLLFSIFILGLIYYSPHFFIKHLLERPIRELRESGVLISLVEPEPRKTALHISIPSAGIRDILLEPQLVISSLIPPALDVQIERNLSRFTLYGIPFKKLNIKLLGRNLFTAQPLADVALGGTFEQEGSFSFEIVAQSQELSNSAISFGGILSVSGPNLKMTGPLKTTWNPKLLYPRVFLDLAGKLYEKKVEAELIFEEVNRHPTLTGEVKNLSHPTLPESLLFHLAFVIDHHDGGSLAIHGNLKEVNRPIHVRFSGSCKPSLSDCKATYKLPVRFDETFSPTHLIPHLKKKLVGWEGELNIAGNIFLRDSRWSFSSEISVKNLSGYVYEIPFVDLNAKASFDLLPTLRSKNPSVVTIKNVGDNLLLEQIRAVFIVRNSRLHIDELRAFISGGSLSLKPVDIPVPSLEGRYLVTLKEMELSKFLESLKSERLSGEGKIEGEFPLRYSGNTFFIENGYLQNMNSGKIRYLDESIGTVKEKIEFLDDFNDLLARGQQALAYKALSNFHYSKLALKMNRNSSQQLSVALHLKGKNPNLAKGQPFEINLPITGNLESFLIGSLLKSSVEREE